MPTTPTLARWAILLAASTALVGCVVAPVESSGTYRHDTVVYTRYGYPPPPRVERRPRAPGPDYAWEQGRWVWSGERYQWHGGGWVYMRPSAPRPPAVNHLPPKRPPAHVPPPPEHRPPQYRPPAQLAPQPPQVGQRPPAVRPRPGPSVQRPHQPPQKPQTRPPYKPKPKPNRPDAERPNTHQPGTDRPQTLPEYPHQRPGGRPAYPGR